MRYDTQNDDGSHTGVIANAALFNNTINGVIARYRHVAQAIYDLGPWNMTVTDNFQSGYGDFPSDITGDARHVGAYETFDVQGSYSGIKGLTITLGIKNFMDKDPPYTNGGGQFQAGYDASYADPRGRFIYGKLSYLFK